MVKTKRVIGLLTVAALLAVSMVAIMGAPAIAKHNDTPNEGGVVLEGDAPDCVGGSCEDGNCGGSIGGVAKHHDAKMHDMDKAGRGGGELPRTGATLPMSSTLALGLGMILVGALFTFLGSPSAKLAGAIKGKRSI